MNADKAFDELLILRIQEGDQEAFELLVKRWHKRLIAFCARFIHDHDKTQDVIQDCWLVIFKQLHRLQDVNKFKAWAYRIVYNKAMDQLKSTKKEHELNLNLPVESSDSVDSELPDIRKLIRELPEQQRNILTLFYLDELSVVTIGEILDLPTGTVKSRLFYAREKLKENIKAKRYENYR